MAHAAIIYSRNMSTGLAGSSNTIMTGRTVVDDASMAKTSALESRKIAGIHCRMTYRAILRGRQVSCILAGTDRTVMAFRTSGYACDYMVKRRLSKICGVMAILATQGSWQMSCNLATTNHIIMARLAISRNAGMIIVTGGKGTRAMAIPAIILSRNRRYGHVIRYCISAYFLDTIMTAITPGNMCRNIRLGMINIRW